LQIRTHTTEYACPCSRVAVHCWRQYHVPLVAARPEPDRLDPNNRLLDTSVNDR
jgi:hypothetical protein